ncbi:DUF302 domain-containing protein [Catellicoccus marimammalium]|uniref:Putative inner membrane or exported protein n=1 Tax=Catellicoccus marimammalium M35/04/3 TaxID=1234409 RepID=K8ZN08_9ENTE|nr:DUF302 domain-containing protein [Catellicoccus marimammalium]EKU26981.1 putative inner membrane or exported protein [Catellicoccus marimammalium M35/04/3]
MEYIEEHIDLSIEEAARRFEAWVTERGMKIFDKIDQCKEARQVDLTIEPTLYYIFGNPKVGTLLMQQDDQITFELPLKLLLIGDNKGTKVIYKNPKEFVHHDRLNEQGQQILDHMCQFYAGYLERCK